MSKFNTVSLRWYESSGGLGNLDFRVIRPPTRKEANEFFVNYLQLSGPARIEMSPLLEWVKPHIGYDQLWSPVPAPSAYVGAISRTETAEEVCYACGLDLTVPHVVAELTYMHVFDDNPRRYKRVFCSQCYVTSTRQLKK